MPHSLPPIKIGTSPSGTAVYMHFSAFRNLKKIVCDGLEISRSLHEHQEHDLVVMDALIEDDFSPVSGNGGLSRICTFSLPLYLWNKFPQEPQTISFEIRAQKYIGGTLNVAQNSVIVTGYTPKNREYVPPRA